LVHQSPFAGPREPYTAATLGTTALGREPDVEAVYRVYALRYGHREALRAEHFYGFDPCGDASMPMDYFVWVAVGPAATVVVDAGFTPEVGRRRGRTHLASPLDLLAAIGSSAADVGHVVITHLHYDHTGYLSSFPAAQFVLQEAEMAFWTGRHAGRGEFKRLCEASDLAFLVEANVEGRVRQLTGDREIMPGISVHLVGGHTPGLQIVRVRTAGGWVVLGSDAAHYRENLEADRPFAIVHTLPLMYDAFDRLQELAGPDGVIVPGHDPALLEQFPSRTPDCGGSIVTVA
jgi:glyoxylase-like metal-dependent hydrolase (beta-lactamase superfamily II)